LEPSLGAARAGLSVPDDLSVDNQRLMAALLAAGRQAGVTASAQSVTVVRSGAIECADGSTLTGEAVVIAAGAWSGRLHPELAGVIRPVKGEILRLRARPGSLPPPRHTVRGIAEGRHVYLVPRDDGGLVVGATQYEAGFDETPRVAGVRDLLAGAELLMPGIADYGLEACDAGLRPGSPDNLPVVGWLEPGVLAATGHGRNGMLLAPITADAVLDLLDGKPLSGPLARRRGV
ncbi:MAG TPA: FAD-dependent oxidoreductase, partial [Pseudonocardiaceae bacterium]|nr:FAD-dependent oxidoreductase [Pseudonocardiaceae bacterium]